MRIVLDTDKETIIVPQRAKWGRSASTVSKYVQMKGIPQNVQLAVENLAQKNM